MTVSYERRYYSVGWNSVVSTLRARAKAPLLLFSPLLCRVPPLTASFAILATPSSSSLASLEPLFLSLCRCLSLSDFSKFPLILYYYLSSSCIVLSNVFLPSHPATPANSWSLCLTLRRSLSLTKTSSSRHAPLAGRILLLSLLLPLA